jgi:hypothetical protein
VRTWTKDQTRVWPCVHTMHTPLTGSASGMPPEPALCSMCLHHYAWRASSAHMCQPLHRSQQLLLLTFARCERRRRCASCCQPGVHHRTQCVYLCGCECVAVNVCLRMIYVFVDVFPLRESWFGPCSQCVCGCAARTPRQANCCCRQCGSASCLCAAAPGPRENLCCVV